MILGRCRPGIDPIYDAGKAGKKEARTVKNGTGLEQKRSAPSAPKHSIPWKERYLVRLHLSSRFIFFPQPGG